MPAPPFSLSDAWEVQASPGDRAVALGMQDCWAWGDPRGHGRLWGISRLFAPCGQLPRGLHAPGSFLTGDLEVVQCQEWAPGPERPEVNGSIDRSVLWIPPPATIPPPARQGAQPAPAWLPPSPPLSEVNWKIKRGGGRDQLIHRVRLRHSDACRNDPCPSLCIRCL